MVSKSGKGSNGKVAWDTTLMTHDDLKELILDVMEEEGNLMRSGMPTRYRCKWWIANDFLGLYTRIHPYLVVTHGLDNLFRHQTTVSVHVVTDLSGGTNRPVEVHISAF